MKFAFTDEQRMLKDTSQSFLAAKSDSMAVRAACRSPQHFDAALWRSVCNDMYWQAVLVPEAHDGLALGWVEMAIIMEAAGERLFTSPLFAVTQSTALLTLCMQSAVRDRCLGDIASGHIVSLALTNAVGADDIADLGATWDSEEGGDDDDDDARANSESESEPDGQDDAND